MALKDLLVDLKAKLDEVVAAADAEAAPAPAEPAPDSTPYAQADLDAAVEKAKDEMAAKFEAAGQDHAAKEKAAEDALDQLVAKFKELSAK